MMEEGNRRIDVQMTLSQHTAWKQEEWESVLSAFTECFRKHGVVLTVTLRREGEEPAFPEAQPQDRLSGTALCMDLTDPKLYMSLSSVLFALLARLRECQADLPVEFDADSGTEAVIYGSFRMKIPRHHLMLADPYVKKHLEACEAADAHVEEIRRLVWEKAITLSEAVRERGLRTAQETRKREASILQAADHAFLQLLLFTEKLSAEGKLTERMKAALAALAEGAWEESLHILTDDSGEDAAPPSLRTPDELLLRCYILRTHTGDNDAWNEACRTMEKAVRRESEPGFRPGSSSSGTALWENLRRQMIRQDYAGAAEAADRCLQHPLWKASEEVLARKGAALAELRRYPEADRAFEKAMELCRERADRKPLTALPVLALCMCERAKALTWAGRNAAARELLRQAQDVLEREIPEATIRIPENSGETAGKKGTPEPVSMCAAVAAARLVQERCRLPEQREQREEARKEIKRSLELLRKARCAYPDPEGVAVCAGICGRMDDIYPEGDQGWCDFQDFSYAKSQIEALRSQIPDALPVLLADICNNRGILLSENRHRFREARQEYLRAAELLEQEAPRSGAAEELLGDCYTNMGLLYQDWGTKKKSKAKDWLRKAKRQYRKDGLRPGKEKLELVEESLEELEGT